MGVGRHLLIDAFSCSSDLLSDAGGIEGLLIKACEAAGLSVKNSLSHFFGPGVTAVVIIGESHISIHTWPELKYAAMDIFVCGDEDPLRVSELILAELKPETVSLRQIERGEAQEAWYEEKLMEAYKHAFKVGGVLVSKRTRYQRLEVIENPFYHKILFLDGRPQLSVLDEWIYHEALVHPAMVTHPRPERVAILGGGDGGALREVLKHNTVREVHLVDIDEDVVQASKEHLSEVNRDAFGDPRVKIAHADAEEFLKGINDCYDVVIMDLTDPITGLSAHLFTSGFLKGTLKKALAAGGVFATQAESAFYSFGYNDIPFRAIARAAQEAFLVARPYRAWVPCFGSEWGFVVASDLHDPLAWKAEEVDRLLRERGVITKFYDGGVHLGLFSLPPYLRRILLSEAPVTMHSILGLM